MGESKCLNREEFVVVEWTDPEGGRGYIGALLLGYFTPEGELVYAGRVGTGMTQDSSGSSWKGLNRLPFVRCRVASRHRARADWFAA